MKRRLLALVFIFLLLVSSYVMVIPSIELAFRKPLIEELFLFDHEGSAPTVEFQMGDTVSVVAVLDSAVNCYFLTVKDEVSEVFSKSDRINGAKVEVGIPLYPPQFKAGHIYVIYFYVCALNYLLPGAKVSDMRMTSFTVGGSQTKLSVEANYDGVLRCLRLHANLTTVDGYPVLNETVDFYTRRINGRPRLTDGWISMGAGETNSSGVSSLNLVFSVPDGNYSFRAHHRGNENFGESEDVIDVGILSNTTLGSFSLNFGSKSGFGGAILSSSVGNLEINVSSSAPYALLYMNATARYIVDDPMGYLYIAFLLDNYSTLLGFELTEPQGAGPPYVYESSLFWKPEDTGSHKLIVAILNGDVIASGEVDLDIRRCPSNLVLHFPEAIYGDALPVTIVFSEPRLYEVVDAGLFSAYTLTSQLLYNNASYMIDEPVESVPVKLYVNGSLTSTNITNQDGLAYIPLQLDFLGEYLTLNLTGVVDDPSILHEGITVERVVSFTNVSVHDVPNGNDLFQLNYTITKPGLGKEIYVGTENSIEVKARLFDLSVGDAPVSALIGRPVKRDCPNASGWGSVPDGSEFIRATSLYDIQSTTAHAACDITGPNGVPDGVVNIRDIATVSSAFGSYPGHSKWNWRADINFDLKVNIRDVALCASNYDKKVTYIDIVDYSVVKVVFFKDGQQEEAWLDSWGCVSVPSDATGFELSLDGEPIGAVVEFFRSVSYQECHTNNIGVARAVWIPAETGCGVSSSSYFLLVRVPSSFQVSVTSWSSVTEVGAPLSLVDFLDVEKRPIEIVLTNSTVYECCVEVMGATADTYVWELHPDKNYGSEYELSIGYDQFGLELRTYVKFDISSVPVDSSILSARLKLFCAFPNGTGDTRNYKIYRSTGSWTETGLNWTNQPPHAGDPTYTLVASPRDWGWWIWDVTEDIREWYEGSVSNYGHVIVDDQPEAWEMVGFASRQFETWPVCRPILEVTYVPLESLPIGFSASLIDEATGNPVSGVSVDFSVNEEWLCTVSTNSSGVATTEWDGPSTTILYNVTASYSGNATYEDASAILPIDFRTPTWLELKLQDGEPQNITDGETIDVETFVENEFYCWVWPPAAAGERVDVYVNGSWYTTADVVYNETDFSWTADSMGVYYFNVSYGGNHNYQLSEIGFVAKAEASPVSLYFNCTPPAFESGETVHLWSKAVNSETGDLLDIWVRFVEDEGGVDKEWAVKTGSDGIAELDWDYDANPGIHVISVMVVEGQDLANCTLAVQPVTLTVGTETCLWLWIERDHTGTGHTIYGRLEQDSLGIPGETIELGVNGTVYTLTTNGTGHISLPIELQPVDEQATTYQITATFNGTNPQTLNSTAKNPYGTEYPVCTTIQYDLRSASNSIILIVGSQSSDALTPTKTPEEMQADAEDSG